MTDYAEVRCICELHTHKCKIDYDSITLPTKECKVVELLNAYIEYTCSHCKKIYTFFGKDVNQYVYRQYTELYGKCPQYNEPEYTKEKWDEWSEKYHTYRDRFYKENYGLYHEATNQVVGDDYRGFGAEPDCKVKYEGFQVWRMFATNCIGENASELHYPVGTILCSRCARKIELQDLWCH